MSKAPGHEDIFLVRATGEPNRHGERTGEPTRTPIAGCVVWPRTSTETGEEVVIEGYGVFAPPTAAAASIEAEDRIECRGEAWDVDGKPGDFRKKSGKQKGFLLFLKKASAR